MVDWRMLERCGRFNGGGRDAMEGER